MSQDPLLICGSQNSAMYLEEIRYSLIKKADVYTKTWHPVISFMAGSFKDKLMH